jgi:hypothetical protein
MATRKTETKEGKDPVKAEADKPVKPARKTAARKTVKPDPDRIAKQAALEEAAKALNIGPDYRRKNPVKKTRKYKPNPVGRPSMFTEELAAEIIDRLSNGERLTSICKDAHMPKFSTINYWETETETVNGADILRRPKFASDIARARIMFAEYQLLEGGDLIDNAGVTMRNSRTGRAVKDDNGEPVKILSHEAIAHARSQANYRQWYAERVHERYRAKQTIEQTGPGGGPLRTVNTNFDANALTDAFKQLLDKGI